MTLVALPAKIASKRSIADTIRIFGKIQEKTIISSVESDIDKSPVEASEDEEGAGQSGA